jgi:two-component system, OmpR family, phosphate regulon sensor histidine kinase PhoR
VNSRAYRIIFFLLSACILSILVLQAYWIRNFYVQKTEAFDRTVYDALEQLTLKLQEQKNLQAIKMTYFIQNGDTIAKTPSRKMIISSEDNVQIIHKNGNVRTQKFVSVNKGKSGKVSKDSVLITGKDEHINIMLQGKKAKLIVHSSTGKQSLKKGVRQEFGSLGDSSEMQRLVDKMMTEIKIMDTELEVGELEALIKRTLQAKGLFLPVEFSLQKLEQGKKTILAQSKNFSEKNTSYKRDLSTEKIINTHEFLFLQFPDQNNFVLAAMKGSLILTLIFSALIMGIFYYVMRLIWRQKKLSEVKNDFVNNMTHELKTPIATISLALDAIKNPVIKNNEELYTNYTRILKEENQKLNRHVERVLQTAMLDKGELPLHKRPVDISSILRKALDDHKLQVEEKNTKIELHIPDEKLLMEGDEQHLQTLFGNLVDNALKYSSGTCHLTIRVEQNKNELSIYLNDKGIGIAEEYLKKIFDTFYRVQGGNLHDVKGFGLGLSYAKSIVEAHGGTIEVKSELGKGSEFVMRFQTT